MAAITRHAAAPLRGASHTHRAFGLVLLVHAAGLVGAQDPPPPPPPPSGPSVQTYSTSPALSSSLRGLALLSDGGGESLVIGDEFNGQIIRVLTATNTIVPVRCPSLHCTGRSLTARQCVTRRVAWGSVCTQVTGAGASPAALAGVSTSGLRALAVDSARQRIFYAKADHW